MNPEVVRTHSWSCKTIVVTKRQQQTTISTSNYSAQQCSMLLLCFFVCPSIKIVFLFTICLYAACHKSIVQRYTFCTTLVNKNKENRSFTTALEAESLVSSDISDFTPYAHAQSSIQHIKYADKTDD